MILCISKNVLAFAAIFMLTGQAAAQTVSYDQSRISVVSRQEKVPVEAQFKRFTAQVAFDPARPEAGKAQIEIDLDSFDIGFADYNDEVKTKNWFDVRSFPRARFVSSSIRALGDGKYEVRGPLTLKGKTSEVSAPFTSRRDGANTVFDGAFTIKRLQFNIGEGVWRDTDTVADDVQIKFHLVVAPGKAPAAKPTTNRPGRT
jgi:polyisoprenoid-binding protein YceI